MRHNFGECGAQQSDIRAREEQRNAEAAGCELIPMAARNSFDDAVKAQAAEMVRHPASRVGDRIDTQHLRQQYTHFCIGKSLKLETEDSQHGQKRLHALIAKAECGGTLAIHFDRPYNLIKSILSDGTVVRDLLDVEQTSMGSKADLPQSGQVLPAFAEGEITRVVDGRFGAQCASLFVILLEARVLVIDRQGRDDALGNDTGTESSRRPSAHLAVKDQLHLV